MPEGREIIHKSLQQAACGSSADPGRASSPAPSTLQNSAPGIFSCRPEPMYLIDSKKPCHSCGDCDRESTVCHVKSTHPYRCPPRWATSALDSAARTGTRTGRGPAVDYGRGVVSVVRIGTPTGSRSGSSQIGTPERMPDRQVLGSLSTDGIRSPHTSRRGCAPHRYPWFP